VTGTCPDLLAALKLRERDLETDAAGTRARLEEVREMIVLIERPARRGRPPGSRAAFTPRRPNPPPHDAGGTNEPDTDDTQDTQELPL
jgi:hypothetical protein